MKKKAPTLIMQITTIIVVLIVGGCKNPSESTSDSGVYSQSRYEGKLLTEQQVVSLLKKENFPESYWGKLVCTAKYESGFYEGAVGSNSNDIGLFQINMTAWKNNCGVTKESLKNRYTNVKCAKKVFIAQGMGAWYAYKRNKRICDYYKLSKKDLNTSDDSNTEQEIIAPTTYPSANNNDETKTTTTTEPATKYCKVNSGVSGVNVRKSANTSASVIEQINGGDSVVFIDRVNMSGCHNNDGIQLQINSGNIEGYSCAGFFSNDCR